MMPNTRCLLLGVALWRVASANGGCSGDSCTTVSAATDTVLLLQTGIAVDGNLAVTAAPLPTAVSATDVPTNAAEAAGIAGNGAADGAAFFSALVINVVTMVVSALIFMGLRNRYPLTYSNNVNIGMAPTSSLGTTKAEVAENLARPFGWVTAALGVAPDSDEMIDSVGLDQAMLLQFTKVCMRILMLIGVPMICIIGPINCTFGGKPAWEIGDYLSSLSFGNVKNGSKLYWLHAFVIWYVVIVVQVNVFQAMKNFVELRFKWLHRMNDLRACTIIVEGIPDGHRSDAKLKEFFAGVFEASAIKSTYVTKDTIALSALIKKREAAEHGLLEAETAWKKAGSPPDNRPKSFRHGDLIDHFTQEKETAEVAIKDEKQRIKSEAPTEGGVNMETGFVTFTKRKFAQMAKSQLYSEDLDEWTVESPPEPADLLWGDLQQSSTKAGLYSTIGWACVVGLYFAYMPLVLGISKVAASMELGPLQSVWEGLAPTMGLQIMVGFLPTFLLIIFRGFLTLKADAWAQKKLQNAYFWFQIVFVVLVTAIGGSVVEFTKTIFFDPLALPDLLGETMPGATHFYMNFLVLQWVTHAMNLIRYVMLGKFFAFKSLYEEEEARQKAEPEDQDYYGIGSRSSRFTINMVLGVVYGTLSPPINLLCWVNFAVCRLVYGYLIPFAEQKKPDIGGPFFVDSLRHIFVGNIIYCVVMTGVLSGRAEMTGFTPTFIAAPSLLYVIWAMQRFNKAFAWEEIPITKLDVQQGKAREMKGTYTQPELN